MVKDFVSLKVKEARDETADAVCITFEIPDNCESNFKFKPGQYLTLRSTIDGEEVRRCYSICSASGKQPRVGIKRVRGGRFSTFANSLKAGDKIDAFPPAGRFTINPEDDTAGRYLLVAAGSGITPVLSIAHSLLEGSDAARVTLLFGNRNSASIMFRSELEALKDRFMDRFHVFHILSRESQDAGILHGRIDPELINKMQESGLIKLKDLEAAFVCGPAQMNEDITKALADLGVDPDRVRTEFFKPAAGKKKRQSSVSNEQVHSEAKAEIILDGSRYEIEFADVSDTVLSAASKSGVEIPFSCKGGMCATCRCKLLEGKVSMEKNYALADWEIDAGFVLGCQSRPASGKIVLDFDAV